MEYTFFNAELCGRFVRFVDGMGLACAVRDDAMEGSVLEVLGELEDAQMDALEAEYESLMDEQMQLADTEEGWVTHRAVGIGVTYANGDSGMISFDLLLNFVANP